LIFSMTLEIQVLAAIVIADVAIVAGLIVLKQLNFLTPEGRSAIRTGGGFYSWLFIVICVGFACYNLYLGWSAEKVLFPIPAHRDNVIFLSERPVFFAGIEVFCSCFVISLAPVVVLKVFMWLFPKHSG